MFQIFKPYNRIEIINGTVNEGHGEIYIHDNAVAQTLTNQNQFYKVTDTWLAGSCSGFTADTSNAQLICNKAGIYHLTAQVNYNGSNNDAYVFAIFVNGVEDISLVAHTDARLLSQTISSPIMGLISLQKNDVVDLRAECTSNAGTAITMVHSNISLSRSLKI